MATKNPKLSRFPKYDTNPFINVPVSSIKLGKKTTKINYNLVPKNKSRSDLGIASITNQVNDYDKTPFIKFYEKGLLSLSKLSKSALQIVSQINNLLQYNQIHIYIVAQDIMEKCGCETDKPYHDGLADLVDKEFLARSKSPNVYFINPEMFFKGNRVDTFLKED